MTNPTPLPSEIADRLGPDGPVANALRQDGIAYEPRVEQQEVARAVARALSSDRHLVVEAGTGVGKSFAYLVPLLEWAVQTGAKVAVATSTIALQEQLVRKDLPLLARALPFDVSFTLVKGRANYLCRRRLGLALQEGARLFGQDGAFAELEAIREWSHTTREGSRQDLPFRPSSGVWDLVRAEQGNCKGRQCEHYARCPYQASRRRAHAVDCLVLNHHVLMSDLALRRSGASFLPQVDAVVVDEAHDLEDTAAEHLGLRVTSLGAMMILGRLWQPRTGRGLLAGGGHDRLRQAVDHARRAAGAFFGAVHEWTSAQADGGGLPRWARSSPSKTTCRCVSATWRVPCSRRPGPPTPRTT